MTHTHTLHVGLIFAILASAALPAVAQVAFEPLNDAQLKAIAAAAPKPARLPTDLKLRLVDYIDCANDDDPHPFASDGFSTVKRTALGAYRETGGQDSSFFGYRFFPAKAGVPHLLVVEYPDDAERIATIFLHEGDMKGLYNSDFHIEGGYYTGEDLPITNEMCTFTAFVWPRTDSPAIVCHNQHHGQPAAMARIWVYEVLEGLPATKVNEPADEPTRQIGIFFEDTRMLKFNFGGYGRRGADRMMQFLKYTGQNLMAFDAIIYGYPKCSFPGIGKGNNDTEDILAAADQYGIDVIAVFDPTEGFKIDDLPTGDLTDPKVLAAWVKGMESFVEVYGGHSSLKGISFGGPAGCNRMASPKFGQLQKAIYEMLQRKRPDLVQHVFFGYKFLHRSIFNEPDFLPGSIVAAWEQSKGKGFREVLAEKVADYYDAINLDMGDYRGKPNMMVHRSYYPNDSRCFRFYPFRTPRYPIFRDFDESPEITALTRNDGPQGACLFGNYFEVTTGMFAGDDGNFWWDRTWIAPQINPAEPYYLSMYTNALAQDDVSLLMNASWVEPTVGSHHLMANFARAYRTLPAKPFDTIAADNFVVVRQLAESGSTRLYALNNHWTPVDVRIELDGSASTTVDLTNGASVGDSSTLAMTLKPYALQPLKTAAGRHIKSVTVTRKADGMDYLRERIAAFETRIAEAKDAGLEVADAYAATLNRSKALLADGKPEQAAQVLAAVPSHELELRLFLATSPRERVAAKATPKPVTIDADLGEWTGGPSLTINTPEQLVCDRWVYNRWRGLDDLSAKVWLARDGERLLIAFEVRDQTNRPGDAIRFSFDANEYDSPAEDAKYDRTIQIEAKESSDGNQAVRVVPGGYVGEVAVDLATLKLLPGRPLGFHVDVVDMDMDPDEFARITKSRRDWRRETRMEWPVNPRFRGTRDPQSCGLIDLE